ncbi:MAG: hypothetical protein AB4372_31925 [Xenococcus sp. (in: cyanobacteria)]
MIEMRSGEAWDRAIAPWRKAATDAEEKIHCYPDRPRTFFP